MKDERTIRRFSQITRINGRKEAQVLNMTVLFEEGLLDLFDKY